MKHFYILFLVAMLLPLTGKAQITLTQSVDPVNITDGGVACWNDSNGEYRENSFFRAYDLAAFGVVGDFNITSVQYGQGSADDGKIITLNIYTATSTDLSTATLTLVQSTTHTSIPADDLTLISVPMTATIPANSIVAFEVMAGDSGLAIEQTYFPGVNTAGQNALSYLKADGCGISTPTDTNTIVPDNHYIMNVIGNDALGIGEHGLESVSVFPNPVKNELKINISDATRIQSIEIYSVTGQLVFRSGNSTVLNLSALSSGVYMLKIKTEDGSVTKKLVKS